MSRHFSLLVLSIFVLLFALPAPAQPYKGLDVPGVVHESDGVDQEEAEAILASADGALYFPGERRLRWFDAAGVATSFAAQTSTATVVTKSRREFRDELDRDFPGFRSNAFGPWLLKLPAQSKSLEPPSAIRKFPISPTATLFSDSFENGLSQWHLANNNAGDYNFAAMGCKVHTGSWSADAVRGGNRGQYLFCFDGYPAGATTELGHANCEGIIGAGQAWLDFYLTAEMDSSESLGAYYLASDGYIYGYEFFGSWPGWYHIVLNLRQWNYLGDLTTQSCPKVIFQFHSDGTGTAGAGPQLDDVTVRTDAPPFLRCSIVASPVSGAAPLAVTFSPAVSGASGSETYQWLFDDSASTSSTNRSATFTYGAAGTYWPRLRIVDADGTRGYAHTKIEVTSATSCSVACTASVAASAATGAAVSFTATATATACSGSPAYQWTFGDGQSSTQQNPSHAYAAAGTYGWSVTVTAGGIGCTKSGSIVVASTSSGSRRRRAALPPVAVFNGTDVLVAPSQSAQTVRYGGASITIPGGMLTTAQHVKVSVLNGAPPSSMKYLKQMGAYEIQIGDLHALPAEVTIRMKYEPGAIRTDMPLDRAVTASYWSAEQSLWVRMPATIDTSSNEIVVQSRHCSFFSWAMVSVGYSVFFKNNFYIVYDKAELNLPANLAWYSNPDKSNYADSSIPDYVEDTMAFLIDAYRKYMTDTKFTAPPTPIDVYVGTDSSPFTDKFSGIILISLLPNNAAQLKFVTAHELFHRVQNVYYYDLGGMLWLKWWLEATADYSGDRVAWGGLGLMGNKISRTYLEAPLTDSGAAHDEGYSTSHFVRYLVDHGANFKAMWDATANPSWFDSFAFLDGLSTYLQTTFGSSSGLNRQYQNFARWFVFDPSSAMPAISDSLHSEVAAYRSTLTSGGDSATFGLAGGYTAKLWGIWFSEFLFDAATPKIKYTLTVDGTLPTYVEADVYLLKGDKRVAGSVPVGTLTQTVKKVEVEVEKGDAVYVLAVNADNSAQTVKVKISGNEFSQMSLGETQYTFLCIPGKDCKGEWCGMKNDEGPKYVGPLTWSGDTFTLAAQGTTLTGQLSSDQKTLLSLTYNWETLGRIVLKWQNLPLDKARSTADVLVFAASGEAARDHILVADPLFCESNHAGIDYSQPVKIELWLSR